MKLSSVAEDAGSGRIKQVTTLLIDTKLQVMQFLFIKTVQIIIRKMNWFKMKLSSQLLPAT